MSCILLTYGSHNVTRVILFFSTCELTALFGGIGVCLWGVGSSIKQVHAGVDSICTEQNHFFRGLRLGAHTEDTGRKLRDGYVLSRHSAYAHECYATR